MLAKVYKLGLTTGVTRKLPGHFGPMITVKHLKSPTARKALQRHTDNKSRVEPYFVPHSQGVSLGYRPGLPRGAGSWVLREFRPGKPHGRYVKRLLGTADDITTADGVRVLSWEDAQKLATGEDRPTITRPGRLTVAQAANDYFATRQGGAVQDRITYTAFIAAEREGIPKLGECSVSELTTGELERWLAAQVPQTEDKDKRRAAQATANRRWNVLRAILNSAYRKDPARVPNDGAWRRVRAFAKADRPRTRTLSAAEAKRLLEALGDGGMRDLAKGALLTGLRCGELLALTAGDVGKGFVRVRESKSRKPRTVPLNAAGKTFFDRLCEDKPAAARLFEQIPRLEVSRRMRAACGWTLNRKAKEWEYKNTGAKLNPPAIFHDLRRSYGSLLLNSGASSDAIQDLLGHADLRMTRRAYAHLTDKTLKIAVRKLSSFG